MFTQKEQAIILDFQSIVNFSRTKTSTFKSRLGKIMHKLYDLEPDNAPEKPLNVDLGVDLYQMENY